MQKKWYESTTIWLNLAGGLVVAINFALLNHVIPDGYVELAMAVLNILNRFRVNPNEKVGAIEKSVV